MPYHDINISIDVESDYNDHCERDLAEVGFGISTDDDKYPTQHVGEQIGLAVTKCNAPRKALLLAHAVLTEADYSSVSSLPGRISEAEDLLVTAAQELVDAWEEQDAPYAEVTFSYEVE